jgi:hypothetical protein
LANFGLKKQERRFIPAINSVAGDGVRADRRGGYMKAARVPGFVSKIPRKRGNRKETGRLFTAPMIDNHCRISLHGDGRQAFAKATFDIRAVQNIAAAFHCLHRDSECDQE